jgi:lipase chaperone LimK
VNNKNNVFLLLAGIAFLLTSVAASTFLFTNKAWEIKSTNAISETQTTQSPSPQSSTVTAQKPKLKITKPESEPVTPKIEELKQSEDLDMELVDASLREYMHSLYFKFRNVKGKEDFLEMIRIQLSNDFPPETAAKLMKIYEAYLDCEIKLQERLITYDEPKNEEDMLFIANDMFAFRVEQLGEELAERLYGQEHKITKYKILNKKIYEDDSLYGAEKEMQLRLLAAEVFGDKADENVYDKTGESLFREKLSLYKKDFEEMDEQGKKEKIREFRLEYLSPEVVESIEAAESVTAANEQKDIDYGAKEKVILDDPELNEDEKQEKIRSIQDEMYGDRADEIRRGIEFSRQHHEKMKKTFPKIVK